MKEDGGHSLSDVAVALQAAHLLMWQHEVEHGDECFLMCTQSECVPGCPHCPIMQMQLDVADLKPSLEQMTNFCNALLPD